MNYALQINRKHLAAITLAGFFAVALPVFAITETVYEQSTSGTGFSNINTTSYWAQTFTAESSHAVSGIRLKIYKTNSPADFRVSLRATSAGQPTGSDLASGTITDFSALQEGAVNGFVGSDTLISFSSSVNVVAGTVYAIVLKTPTEVAGSSIGFNLDAWVNPYAGGQTFLTVNDSASWISIPDHDAWFRVINVDTSAQLTVTKTVVNDNGGTKTVADFPLFVDSTSVTSGAPGTFNAGTYTISETAQTGYASVIGGDCAADGSVTLSAGDNKTCTIESDDEQGTLSVKSVVVNDNGGTKASADFSFSIDSAAAVSFLAGGQNDVAVDAGTYSITAPAVNGYDIALDNCSSVLVDNGGANTCTITFDDIAPKLTVNVSVINDDSGVKAASDFLLFVDSGAVSNGLQAAFAAGGHTVSQTPDTDYTSVIGGDCAADGSIALALGDVKTCTVVNDDIAVIVPPPAPTPSPTPTPTPTPSSGGGGVAQTFATTATTFGLANTAATNQSSITTENSTQTQTQTQTQTTQEVVVTQAPASTQSPVEVPSLSAQNFSSSQDLQTSSFTFPSFAKASADRQDSGSDQSDAFVSSVGAGPLAFENEEDVAQGDDLNVVAQEEVQESADDETGPQVTPLPQNLVVSTSTAGLLNSAGSGWLISSLPWWLLLLLFIIAYAIIKNSRKKKKRKR